MAKKENKDLMKASYYYTHFAYFEAIPYYEKIAPVMNDPVIYSQMADCYNATNNTEKATETYAKAVALPGCSSIVMLRYAQLLMQLTRYEEAAKWLKEYKKTNKTDQRADNMIAGCLKAKAILGSIPQGTTTLLPFNTDGSEFAPTLWKGMLVFASDTAIDTKKKTDNWSGHSYYNIYSVHCDGNGNCTGDLNKLTETKQLNSQFHDGPCTFSADGKQMYYTRSRSKNNFMSKGSIPNKDSIVLLEIMIADDFDSSSRKFKTVTPFEYNSKAYSVAHPAISPNGQVLVFSSNKPNGAGCSDLYFCRKVHNKWAKPQNAGSAINTEGEEMFPFWGDESTLFFSSDGHEGLGGLDIYQCKWNNTSGIFTDPVNIGTPINSSYDDISLALFADGRSTYFSSNRPANKGGDNLWFYKKEKLYLHLTVTDSATRQPLSDVNLSINTTYHPIDTFTNISGMYFSQLFPGAQYTIKISKDHYLPGQISFIATSQKDIDTIYKTVSLFTPPPPLVNKTDTIEPVPTSFVKIVGTPEVDKIYEIGHFYFAFNSAELNDTAKVVLDSLVDFLAMRPTMKIQIRAHTDCRGGDAYNLKLSDERAHSVVNYLKQKGITAERLTYKGFGLREPHIPCPICEKCSERQHYLNRVLEFKVLQL